MSEEQDLQTHIRRILHNYVSQHLTYNYVDFTEQAVSEILSQCLRQVPLSDSYSLRPPTEPFEVLTRMHHLASLPRYQEMFQMSADAQYFFHRQCQKILVKTYKTKSECIVFDDDNDSTSPEEQFHTVLSRCARLQTPKPRPNRFLSSLPKHPQKFLLSKPVRIEPVSVDLVENAPLNRDKTLNLTWKLMPEMLKKVNVLLRSTATLSVPGPSYRNQYLDPSARRDSPPLSTEDDSLSDRDFTPLFPRTLRPGTDKTIAKGTRTKVILKLKREDSTPSFAVPPPSMRSLPLSSIEVSDFKEEEEELYKQNLLLVNGWQTYNFSSPTSTPSLSQGSDQIDELLFSRVSSPSIIPSSADLPKLDLPAIARCHRISGARSRPNIQPHGAGKILAAFLLGMIPQLSDQCPIDPAPTERADDYSDPVQSIVAQATSRVDEEIEEKPNACTEAISNLEIQGLYQKLNDDPMTFILNEKLDHNVMMMEVPRLPPPNVHSADNLSLPVKLSDLVLETKKGPNKAAENPRNDASKHGPRILKKARGIQAVTLTLSWATFSVQYGLPTHMEVTGVTISQIIDRDDNKNGLSREQLESGVAVLLNSVSGLACSPTTHNTIEVCVRMWHDESELPANVKAAGDIHVPDIILTREERRRLAGAETQESKNDLTIFSLTQDHNVVGLFENDGPEAGNSHKEYEHSATLHEDYEDPERPSKRLRMDDMTPSVDDSGISFALDLREQGLFQMEGGAYRMDAFLYDEAATGTVFQSTRGFNDDQGMNGILSRPSVGSHHVRMIDDDRYSPEHHEFQALCFDSQSAEIPIQNIRPNDISNDFPSGILPSSTPRPEPQTDGAFNEPTTSALVGNFPPSVETYHITAGIAEFAKLRAKRLCNVISLDASDIPRLNPTVDHLAQCNNDSASVLSTSFKSPPQEIFSQHTIQFPPAWMLPTSAHWYLGSMSLVQKQALIRCLRSEMCGVGIVEREDLNGVDLILDPNTAIIFTNLRALPSESDSLVTLISDQSWRYSRLLIIFEAYPPSWSLKPTHDSEALTVFTPPVLKSIKKLRRDLSIAEGCSKKRSGCQVLDAFAIDVEQAAKHTRNFGDIAASSNDNVRCFWGDRSWLEEGDVSEDEHGLAIADGMNHFAAFVVLCQIGVQDLLDMSPEERTSTFGPQLGDRRIDTLNVFIEQRLRSFRETDT